MTLNALLNMLMILLIRLAGIVNLTGPTGKVGRGLSALKQQRSREAESWQVASGRSCVAHRVGFRNNAST
jgi:hypothetical protein